MILTLAGHLSLIETEVAASAAAPLSIRKTLLAMTLMDGFADRLFAAGGHGADDVLAFRASLVARCQALGLVFGICAQREDGPQLRVETVEVPLERYPDLSVQDFMVSLYNNHSVQRVMVELPDGGRQEAQAVIAEAMGFWRGMSAAD